jgi:hypothetical protein
MIADKSLNYLFLLMKFFIEILGRRRPRLGKWAGAAA